MKEDTNHALSDASDEKKALKRTIARGTWAVTINLLMMNIIVVLGMFGRLVYDVIKTAGSIDNFETVLDTIFNDDDLILQYAQSGVEYLVSIGIGLLIVGSIMKKSVSIKQIFATDNKMTISALVVCFFVFMIVQFPFDLTDFLIEKILNQFGLTIEMGTELASGSSTTLSMVLYSIFGAPIAEELIYRGYIMKSLKKYGANFAIVISSLFFGLMHTNLTQSIFAFFVGLVLGYGGNELFDQMVNIVAYN